MRVMSDPADLLSQVPTWLLRPIATNALCDEKLEAAIDKLAAKLPESLDEISFNLNRVDSKREYDSAANRAIAHVWRAVDRFFAVDANRSSLLSFAKHHMFGAGQTRVLRRLSKDTELNVRRAVHKFVEKSQLREVSLPEGREGDWDATGWLRGVRPGRLLRQRAGHRRQGDKGVPAIKDVGDLRKLLDIRSDKQLGYLLLATDKDGGPYTQFTIPKRDGSDRRICAPKPQLRWVQRRLLDKILRPIPVHEAAHGFVVGRSTVTNRRASSAGRIGSQIRFDGFLSDNPLLPSDGAIRRHGV